MRIAVWHVDEDESGGTQDRPGLLEAIRRVEDRETDGIACWRLNRFARNVAGAIGDVERIQSAGGVLAFVEEDIDPTGPFGDFILKVLLAVAELELNNVKAGWKIAKARAVERGAHIGPTPIGYQRREDGTLEIDPDRGPVITAAFAIAARDGMQGAIGFLREHIPERTWTAYTTRRLLDCRTYLGRVGYGDLANDRAHEALVTRAVFEAAKLAIGPVGAPRRAAAEFPLSGIAACESCGGRMVGGRGGADQRRVYRCATRCNAPVVISAELLEAHVVAELREAFEHPGFQVGAESPDTAAHERAVAEAEHALDEFASDLKARELLGHRYHHHLEQRVDAVEAAEEELRRALAGAEHTRVVVPAELWDDLRPGELADVLRGGLDTVIVGRGHRPVGERVRVIPKGMDRAALTGAEDP